MSGWDFRASSATVNQHLQSVLAVQLALVFEVVRQGGTFACSGGADGYTFVRLSTTGGRGVSAEGPSLHAALHALLVLWGKV